MIFPHDFICKCQAQVGIPEDFPEAADCPLWLQLRSHDLQTTADVFRAQNGDLYMSNYKTNGILFQHVWKISLGQFVLGMLEDRMNYEKSKKEAG